MNFYFCLKMDRQKWALGYNCSVPTQTHALLFVGIAREFEAAHSFCMLSQLPISNFVRPNITLNYKSSKFGPDAH